jgi:diguanylate cyclase (GGDEF)-like protein
MGVLQLRKGKLVRLWEEKDGLPDRFTFALAYDSRQGQLFLGTWAGTVCLKDEKLVPLPPQLAQSRPLALHLDLQGRLWVALRDGKVLLGERSGELRVLGAREGLSDQVVWCIASQGSKVWLGTNGDGAFCITPQGIERWDRQRGLADDFVWQVLPDRQGRVWFYTSQGLDRLDKGTIKHFGIQDGLPDLEGSANACLEDAAGTLWFGTASGLLRFDPAPEATLPPPPILLEAATFGRNGVLTPGATLPADPGPLVFSLVSLSFRHERALQFSFRLLPVSTEWSAPQRLGDITFAALGPGKYRFEAVAVDADGQRSREPVSFPFVIAAPWWQRPPFLAVAAFSLLLMGFALNRWRVARLEALAQRLEQEVARRTQELAEKAEELKRLAETDELTGLPNRRRFFVALRGELQRLWRAPAEARLSLLLLDLDGFKNINDTLGHTAGDALLQGVAQALLGAVRSTDTVARFGGDEFAVILPMTDRAGATVAAQKILQAVQATEVVYEGHRLRVSASAGLAVAAPSAAFKEEEVTRLIQRADVALYAAKRRGGNALLDDQETWA